MAHARGRRWLRWPAPDGSVDGPRSRIAFGADYNPEQWPRATWDTDVRLMKAAGVNIVSLAIFSWSHIQPAEDEWDFAWLDEIVDLLHENGIAVDLATATASPPPWLTVKHPEVLPVTRTGETLWPGARQHWRPTSPVFRAYALRLVEAMATRYGGHPAIAAWHVSNELGCHNVYDYSDDAAAAFREWLRTRYDTMDVLNHAWGTAFWSQRYGDWSQILPPRLAAAHPNPTQQLDFKRFSSDALKDHLRAERELLDVLTPDIPVTTNFMVMSGSKGMDYADWAAEVDFVSNDHYVLAGPRDFDELSFCANRTSGIAAGAPWFLMEHSTSAVNWQPINRAKRAGELARDSLTHVAHGADAVCFFQWRQSAAGAEKYHSAMVPHAGEHSALFDSIVDLGARLRELQPLTGSRREPARVALLFDQDSWWTSELDSHPTSLLRYHDEALDWYTTLLDLGVRADVVPASADLAGYDVVVAPILHVMPVALTERLTEYVAAGGHLVTTYFSGIVDENDRVWLGGYPGALAGLLGIRIEEFGPLLEGESVVLDNGTTGSLWTDRIDVTDARTSVLASYTTGEYAGRAAITRRRSGDGSATYVSSRLGPDGLAPVLTELLDHAGVTSELPADLRGRVELAVRGTDRSVFRFLINRTSAPVRVEGVPGTPLGAGILPEPDGFTLPGRGVAILREERP